MSSIKIVIINDDYDRLTSDLLACVNTSKAYINFDDIIARRLNKMNSLIDLVFW